MGSAGKTRLDDPRDFVRIEIELVLKRQIPVIPVLVSGATIPPAKRLPLSIQDLSYLQTASRCEQILIFIGIWTD